MDLTRSTQLCRVGHAKEFRTSTGLPSLPSLKYRCSRVETVKLRILELTIPGGRTLRCGRSRGELRWWRQRLSVTLGMEAREEAVAFRKDDWHGPPYPLRPREADGVAAFVLERADDPLGIGATGDIHYEPLGVLGRDASRVRTAIGRQELHHCW